MDLEFKIRRAYAGPEGIVFALLREYPPYDCAVSAVFGLPLSRGLRFSLRCSLKFHALTANLSLLLRETVRDLDFRIKSNDSLFTTTFRELFENSRNTREFC